MNGDQVIEADVAQINADYQALLTSATESTQRLSPPAVRNP